MATLEDLELALMRLAAGDRDAVILQSGDTYVQAAKSTASNFSIEAVSDEFLRKRLSPDQLRKLTDLGFQPPLQRVSPNHWRNVPANAPATAKLLAETLTSVYGLLLTDAQVTEV